MSKLWAGPTGCICTCDFSLLGWASQYEKGFTSHFLTGLSTPSKTERAFAQDGPRHLDLMGRITR